MNESDAKTASSAPEIMIWVGRVISGLAALMFTMSAFMKLKGGPEVTEGVASFGLSGVAHHAAGDS